MKTVMSTALQLSELRICPEKPVLLGQGVANLDLLAIPPIFHFLIDRLCDGSRREGSQ